MFEPLFLYLTAPLPTVEEVEAIMTEESPEVEFAIREPETFSVTERYEV